MSCEQAVVSTVEQVVKTVVQLVVEMAARRPPNWQAGCLAGDSAANRDVGWVGCRENLSAT